MSLYVSVYGSGGFAFYVHRIGQAESYSGGPGSSRKVVRELCISISHSNLLTGYLSINVKNLVDQPGFQARTRSLARSSRCPSLECRAIRVEF